MATSFDCPFARPNEHYPHEDMVTPHKCAIKPCSEFQCDEEDASVKGGCALYHKIREDREVMEFVRGWYEKAGELAGPHGETFMNVFE